ncbi:MAG: transglycosylase domain-containing protein [Desulfobacterales bacterium]|nr:transglycosylase domain-containing protein [Desulfobacterales bacterium]
MKRFNRTEKIPLYMKMQKKEAKRTPKEVVKKVKKRSISIPMRIFCIIFIGMVAGYYAYEEMYTSTYQAKFFSQLASKLYFHVNDGPAQTPLVSPLGPYDERMGYVFLPKISIRLKENLFDITQQAEPSSELINSTQNYFLFPIYNEKSQAGLSIVDRYDQPIFINRYPGRTFKRFSDIPDIIVQMLLYIENRELLSKDRPFLNPAVEWDRLGKAVLEKIVQIVQPDVNASGGSTLATQMEKFRHSEKGITFSARDKLSQMLTASVRSYRNGPYTYEARKKILLDYMNSIPLSARFEYGEITGLGDGLWAWYGTEFDTMMSILHHIGKQTDHSDIISQARIVKQVLSLFIAHKRPTDYLHKRTGPLNEKCNQYLDVFAKQGILSRQIVDQAKDVELEFRSGLIPRPPATLVAKKAINAVRTPLLSLLGIDKIYDLDRFDLTIRTTLDLTMQQAVTSKLIDINDPEIAKTAGLYGKRLLGDGASIEKVIYSFTLYESTEKGNVLRIQTDNYDQPLNINEGIKLELGSTAKLRTLIHYLEIIEILYNKFASKKSDVSREISIIARQDRLSQWALLYLAENKKASLKDMLDAAMQRKYSASPYEQFFTGGGLHSFENFNKDDNHKILTVSEALTNSINLVFIRMMREIVYYHMYKDPVGRANLLQDIDNPERKSYLKRFALKESAEFIRRFYNKYKNDTPDEAISRLLQSVRPIPSRLSVVFRMIKPNADTEEFEKFLKSRLPDSELTGSTLYDLYEKYDSTKWTLADRGYIARIHPLELWLVSYIYDHKDITLDVVLRESEPVIDDVYRWLFRTSRKSKQDKRIKTILEIEAFDDIYQAWKKLGYPFSSLVPSYATSIGISADRPASLAELIGIVLNHGNYLPSYRVEELHFAKDTPYHVSYVKCKPNTMQALNTEIATIVKDALLNVVEQGTARRAANTFVKSDGTVIRIGGKTGTGDNRYEVYGTGGRLISSKAVNRTATFVFFIGERFYGTITAFVPGKEAAHYSFTSSLPLAVLKFLGPTLMPLIDS